MNALPETILGYQPDIYQRYAYFARLVEAVFGTPERRDRCRLLDVGSGPERLTEAFLPQWVDVVRADVQTFNQPGIIEIRADGTLPAADLSFDIVLAMDVLEHIPADRRTALIAECQRVAARGVIFGGPVAAPEVVRAEERFAAFARAASGRDLAFLAEHARFGLPDTSDILAAFDAHSWHLANVENSPLAEWQLFNALDLIYASDVGEGEAKWAINRLMNSRSAFRRAGAPHYRMFICALRRETDARALAQWLAEPDAIAPSLTPLALAELTTELLAVLRRDLRESSAMQLGAKDAHIEKLGAMLQGLVAEKDAQISKLRDDAFHTTAAHAARVEQLERECAAARQELAAIRASRTWRLTAPVRHIGNLGRRMERRVRLAGSRGSGAAGRDTHGQPPETGTTPRALVSRLQHARRTLAGTHVAAALRRELRTARTEMAALRSAGAWTRMMLLPARRLAALQRRAAKRLRPVPSTHGPAPQGNTSSSGRRDALRPRYAPPQGLLPWFNPLTLAVSERLSAAPRLNVLVPGLAMKHMSGGPNTALALACALAVQGVAVRFLSTDAPPDPDATPFWDHLKTLTRVERLPQNMELVDAHDRSRVTYIGAHDLFMATAWWTAQQAKYATRLTRQETFLYLIQDYEPLLHAASTQYALAGETYELAHLPIINTSLLHDFLSAQRIGRFRDESFARAALVFEPALDQAIFHPDETPRADSRRRLLFYARPTNGLRNLFEMGVAALQKAIADGVFNPDEWEFLGMGEPFAPVALGGGAMLRPVEWVNLQRYAQQMRESDILLSLMLSPHPSYPPLEMAASAGVAVTTTFETKTAQRLSELSHNIIGVPPTIESLTSGLAAAVRRLTDRNQRVQNARLPMPQTWDESFAPILPKLTDALAQLQGSPSLPSEAACVTASEPASVIFPGFASWPASDYEVYRRGTVAQRRDAYKAADASLFSLLTPVWNTDPVYLEALAQTVLGQDLGTGFEWIVVDNASTRADTLECLARMARHPAVRLHRQDRNLGIIAGTRRCLEHAANRYVVPLDHDDLLMPDALRVLAHCLRKNAFPAVAYSDEDKLQGQISRDPYFKPDWDPVLFVNSCYTSHVCALDRQLSLQLGAYTDPETEGSPDWDAFTRFYIAGYAPLHVPEVLYTWRMHTESTAGNIGSKPYVFAAQRRVLSKVLAAAPDPSLYRLDSSPLFDATPDWWLRRISERGWPITTVIVKADPHTAPRTEARTDFPHEVVVLDRSDGLQGLLEIAARCADEGRLVHVLWSGTIIEEQEWPWEAMGHFELFPDTVMIGGRIHDGTRILMGARYFGFGAACDSPDRGRELHDPGYFAQMWKQHSVGAVSIRHCVIRAPFLRDTLRPLVPSDIRLEDLGPWLGAAARESRGRVVYSPFFSASTTLDLDERGTDVGRAAFRSAYRALLGRDRYLSSTLGLTPETAYRPTSRPRRLADLADASTLLPYPEWGRAERLARAVRYPPESDTPRITLLTTLYSGTAADLFRQTAESLLAQTRPFAEWVVLLHGPIAAEVEGVVAHLATDERVRVLRRDDNVGIINGLRLCLEHASGDYIVPMDADDLLSPDALQTFAAAIRENQPDLIYSDEDTLRGDILSSPYFRPDFDPVLNAESSYVWHLCAYRRDKALQLGVYQDAGAEYCHDWDTLCRFAESGGHIAHSRHVLYHWRAHPASHSNSGGQHPGSVASTKWVLNRTISRQSDPDLYEVAPFPIFRGLHEWYIQRRTLNAPNVDAIAVRARSSPVDTLAALQSCGFPFRMVHDYTPENDASWSDALAKILEAGGEFVLLAGSDADGFEAAGIWDAIKLFELHPALAVVGGRLLDYKDAVVEAGDVADRFGRLVAPFDGLKRTDSGPFAMALKAHCVTSPTDCYFVARTAFLKRAMDNHPPGLRWSRLTRWLGAYALAEAVKIAYSPLLEARTHAERQRDGDDRTNDFSAFLEYLELARDQSPSVMGVAGHLDAERAIASAT